MLSSVRAYCDAVKEAKVVIDEKTQYLNSLLEADNPEIKEVVDEFNKVQ